MNFKHVILSASLMTIGLLSINAVKKGEPKDILDKRKFTVTMTEVKDGVPAKKGIEDEIEFKAGKGMFSNFMYEKNEMNWTKYEITKDTTFVDEDQNENKVTEVKVSTTDASDQTIIINCVVTNYEIHGDVKITKKDKLKKKYEFSGKEKEDPKKKKK